MLLGTRLLAQCLRGQDHRLSPLPAVVVINVRKCLQVWPLVSFVMQGKTLSYAAATAEEHF